MKKSSSKPEIPFFIPWITENDKAAVNKALSARILTVGPKLEEFERMFAKFTGARYAIGVSNATTALHLSLKALGIGKGDEVIIPDLTFIATANAVIHSGATPVFADVEDDLNISIDSIKKKVTRRTKAILPVHFAGKVCNIKPIRNFAKANNLLLIEDCAHAIGARADNQHVGTFGNAGCFSFYPTKNITTIEGGMIITNSLKVANYVRASRNHGMTKTLSQRYSHGKPWDYDVIKPGYNFRLDEIRSALGISQLKRVEKLNTMRRAAFLYYTKKLSKIRGVIAPSIEDDDSNACHIYIIKLEKGRVSRDVLFKKMLNENIVTTVHYKPLHKFSAYKKMVHNVNDLKNAEYLYQRILSLPFYPQISKKTQDKVIDCIRRAVTA